MLRRTTAIFTAALVLGAVAAPAALAKGPSGKGGKKPVGTVATFDGTTLTVTMNDGSTQTATADDSTKVKVDHRGRPAAKGNPTRGGLEDLVAGTLVLRLKTDDGVLEKVRIRRTAPAAAPVPTDDADEEGDDTDDADDEGEDAVDEGDDTDDEAEEADDETELGDDADLGDEADDAVDDVTEEIPA